MCRKQSSGNHQKEYQQISKQKVCFLEKVYRDREGIWGKEYLVSTVGTNKERIRRYVKLQEEEEKQDKQSFSFEPTTPVKAWELITRQYSFLDH
ncbi:unnamed protein product [marine sediment metagenome]|uniref:Transposase IS200-like domain-containing protein n=1 Tax=marine sediment metagenome TaxID=412755 RepID=X0XUC8_9ZZZZ